jgi:hypothetical protein
MFLDFIKYSLFDECIRKQCIHNHGFHNHGFVNHSASGGHYRHKYHTGRLRAYLPTHSNCDCSDHPGSEKFRRATACRDRDETPLREVHIGRQPKE